MAMIAGRAYCISNLPTGFDPNSSVALFLSIIFLEISVQSYQVLLRVATFPRKNLVFRQIYSKFAPDFAKHPDKNMSQRPFLLIAFAMMSAVVLAAIHGSSPRVKYPGDKNYTFRVQLKDKRGCGFSIDKPKQFLSHKSIDRRHRFGIAIDSTDLPVSYQYLKEIRSEQLRIIGMSKWNNTVLVNCYDTSYIQRIRQLPYVESVTRVWTSPDSITARVRRSRKNRDGFNPWDSVANVIYGKAHSQVEALGGISLHQQGYRGEGMTIAVLDGGFAEVDRKQVFKNIDIKGVKDFVYPSSVNFFNETDHGTKVLSAMAVNAPEVYIGTAPKASYWLLRCEDQQTEQPIEEDYWAMAAEFADSVGVDVINSSLGYYEYDNHYGDHPLWHLDGRTALISRTASMLAGKGIILVNSAGNNGMGPWKKITFPADAHDILTVGAVTTENSNAPFSGVGNTADGRIKPDVVALGSPAVLVSSRGTVLEDMGTSFSTPLVCGLVACLWQALPSLTPREIIELVRHSGDNDTHPDNIFGYGIPDFYKALKSGRNLHPDSSSKGGAE